MVVFTNGTWVDGCTHTIINNNGKEPNTSTIAEWLHKLSFDEFCDALQDMIDEGYMDEEKADKTYNAYANNHFNQMKGDFNG